MLRSRPTAAQVTALVDYMESHQSLALGRLRGAQARFRSGLMWEGIAAKLNAMGGSVKPTKIWMKYWADKKAFLKKAAGMVRRSYNQAGDTDRAVPFCDTDQRILAIMGERFVQRDALMVPPFKEMDLTPYQQRTALQPIAPKPSHLVLLVQTPVAPKKQAGLPALAPKLSEDIAVGGLRQESKAASNRDEFAKQAAYNSKTLRSRPNSAQIAALVEFMEANRSLVSGRVCGREARRSSKLKWAGIAEKLNGMGGSVKPTKIWMKFWADKKGFLKRTVALERGACYRTDAGRDIMFNDLDRRILRLMGERSEGQSMFKEPKREQPPPPDPLQPDPLSPHIAFTPAPEETSAPEQKPSTLERNFVEIKVEVISTEEQKHDQQAERHDGQVEQKCLLERQCEQDEGQHQQEDRQPQKMEQQEVEVEEETERSIFASRREDRPRKRIRSALAREKERFLEIESRRAEGERAAARAQAELAAAVAAMAESLRGIAEQMARQTTMLRNIEVALQKNGFNNS